MHTESSRTGPLADGFPAPLPLDGAAARTRATGRVRRATAVLSAGTILGGGALTLGLVACSPASLTGSSTSSSTTNSSTSSTTSSGGNTAPAASNSSGSVTSSGGS